jgi:hypothetical protein
MNPTPSKVAVWSTGGPDLELVGVWVRGEGT